LGGLRKSFSSEIKSSPPNPCSCESRELFWPERGIYLSEREIAPIGFTASIKPARASSASPLTSLAQKRGTSFAKMLAAVRGT
jgi:hypothetical protein